MKIDILLHDHLDGSFPLLSILPQLFRLTHEGRKMYPFNPWQDHRDQIKKLFSDVHTDIVQKFSITTGVLQDIDTLYIAAKNYTEIRARQGFKYCEATIAPQYLTSKGLTEKQVIEALIRGIKRGEENYPQIEVNLLFAIGREVSPEEGIGLARIAVECDPDYVPGISLVCDEAKHPPEKHRPAFIIARDAKRKTSCHASEWVSDERDFYKDMPLLLKNLRTAAYLLRADRLEHATTLAYDEKLIDYVVKNGIGVGACPGSNLSTGVIPDLESLKIRKLLEKDVLYSLHPDDDLFLPDLNETFDLCNTHYRFSGEEELKLRINAWKTRFGRRKPPPSDIMHLI